MSCLKENNGNARADNKLIGELLSIADNANGVVER